MKENNILDKIVELVLTCDDKMLSDLTVSNLAGLFNIDRSYLSRQFQSSKDCTLSKFIQKEKMWRAAVLLKDSRDLTVTELSEKMGFCSTEHFRKVFKKHFGVLPGRFRECKSITSLLLIPQICDISLFF